MSVFGSIGKWFSSDQPYAADSLTALEHMVDASIQIGRISEIFPLLPQRLQGPLAVFVQDTINAKAGQEPTLEQSPALKQELDHSSSTTLVLFKQVVNEIGKLAGNDNPRLNTFVLDELNRFANSGMIDEHAQAYKGRTLMPVEKSELIETSKRPLLSAPLKSTALMLTAAA